MRISVTGQLTSAVFDKILGEYHSSFQEENPLLELDLSSAEWCSPGGLVPVAALLRSVSRGGGRVKVAAYPSDKDVCAYYCRMDFFRLIGARSPCANHQRIGGQGRFIEITELDHPEIEAETSAKLAGLLHRLPKAGIEVTDASRQSFIDASGELVSNTRHAYPVPAAGEANVDAPAALIQAQFYPKRGIVKFCVCDCGIGMKRSMEGEHKGKFKSHLESIDAALAFRNRSETGGGQGLGLSALQSYIKKNGGTLRIRTGDALKVQRGLKIETATQLLPSWDGTIVGLEIRVEKAADLSKITKRFATQ
jgi:hypothetical protein